MPKMQWRACWLVSGLEATCPMQSRSHPESRPSHGQQRMRELRLGYFVERLGGIATRLTSKPRKMAAKTEARVPLASPMLTFMW